MTKTCLVSLNECSWLRHLLKEHKVAYTRPSSCQDLWSGNLGIEPGTMEIEDLDDDIPCLELVLKDKSGNLSG